MMNYMTVVVWYLLLLRVYSCKRGMHIRTCMAYMATEYNAFLLVMQ